MQLIESKSLTEHLVELDNGDRVTVYTAPGADPLAAARQASKPQPGLDYVWDGADWVFDQNAANALAAVAQVKAAKLAALNAVLTRQADAMNLKYPGLNIDPAADSRDAAVVKLLAYVDANGQPVDLSDCANLDLIYNEVKKLTP